jgi:hypothetical protein
VGRAVTEEQQMHVLTRHKHRGLHGPAKIDRQRLLALLLIAFGCVRVIAWLALILLYAIGVPFTHTLFLSVAFVALISLYANAATDFGQVCASLAQLTAGDAHHDSEHNRRVLSQTFADIERIEADINRLAGLSGGDALELAEKLCATLRSASR